MASGKKEIPGAMNFALGGFAGMTGTFFVQPMDLIKTRMQISKKEYKNTFHAIKTIIANEGFFALYNGLSAGLLRQATYSTTRLGLYNWLFGMLSSPDGAPPSFATKAGLGMVAGATGALVGTPAEVALIRQMSDGKLPPAERRNYKNVIDALFRMAKEEGIFTLWRGVLPTMFRAVIVNAVQLATYSQAKEWFMSTGYFKEGIPLHFCASMTSGLFTTIASLPVDAGKTRMQNMKIIDGKPEYSSALDVITKLIKNEGVLSLWKGFTPYYARIGPHTVITFIFLEQYTKAYKKFFMN